MRKRKAGDYDPEDPRDWKELEVGEDQNVACYASNLQHLASFLGTWLRYLLIGQSDRAINGVRSAFNHAFTHADPVVSLARFRTFEDGAPEQEGVDRMARGRFSR